MARVPITLLGFRCERCGHEWLPRGISDPKACPACRSTDWNSPFADDHYEDFKRRVVRALRKAKRPITWSEIRTQGQLIQMFPNNKWVRKLEKDVRLVRFREGGVMYWRLGSQN